MHVPAYVGILRDNLDLAKENPTCRAHLTTPYHQSICPFSLSHTSKLHRPPISSGKGWHSCSFIYQLRIKHRGPQNCTSLDRIVPFSYHTSRSDPSSPYPTPHDCHASRWPLQAWLQSADHISLYVPMFGAIQSLTLING
eukprot:TRINITY_DN1807_c0_g1_i3.p1 TRINITY_DN1807_c0_g1~~TRINITY_DN1807_c0_g1_i3.p1  ORF type:complete len:140 (+),score=5.15 TRINITY_DN1807_c0_g1_i3:1513-1932(+)